MKVFIILLSLVTLSVAFIGPDFMNKIKEKIGGGGGGKGMFELKCQGEKINFSDNEQFKEASKVCDGKKSDSHKARKNEKSGDDNKGGNFMDKIKDTFKNFNIKDIFESFKPNMACSMICKGKALKLVKDDGKVDHAEFEKFVGNFVTKDVAKSLAAGAKKCFSEQPNLLITEDTCKDKSDEITSLLKCLGKSAKEVCDVKKN